MAAPVESFIRIADDTSYTGKGVRKVREQSRVVGANTVYEQMRQKQRSASIIGNFRAATSQLTVSATVQDGTSSGFLWFFLPSGVPAGREARIRQILVSTHLSTTLVASSAPRLMASRFSWTGSATGATVNPVADDTYVRPMLDLRTAVTGMTVSMGANFFSFPIAGDISAVSAYTPHNVIPIGADRLASHAYFADEAIYLSAGEGIVLWQDVAGTAADTRKINIILYWDEIDAA